MDPVVAAFGTALVGAIATDAWKQVGEAVTGCGAGGHPRREDDGIGAELAWLADSRRLPARRPGKRTWTLRSAVRHHTPRDSM